MHVFLYNSEYNHIFYYRIFADDLFSSNSLRFMFSLWMSRAHIALNIYSLNQYLEQLLHAEYSGHNTFIQNP